MEASGNDENNEGISGAVQRLLDELEAQLERARQADHSNSTDRALDSQLDERAVASEQATRTRIQRRADAVGDAARAYSRPPVGDAAAHARGRTATPSVRELLAKAEQSRTTIGAIRAVSELVAESERWLLILIGRALADETGPAWPEIGQALSGLDPAGEVVRTPLTRQGVRQRYDKYTLVKRQRLMSRIDRLETDLLECADTASRLPRSNPVLALATLAHDIGALVPRIRILEAEIADAVGALRSLDEV